MGNLDALHDALQVLINRRDIIRRFFQTAFTMGQAMNWQTSNNASHERGFKLDTLKQLPLTKSTKYPSLSMLHFVLALIDEEDALALFNDADIMVLRQASTLKTDKVIQEALDLAKGLYGVQAMFEGTGKYSSSRGAAVTIERRRRSSCRLPEVTIVTTTRTIASTLPWRSSSPQTSIVLKISLSERGWKGFITKNLLFSLTISSLYTRRHAAQKTNARTFWIYSQRSRRRSRHIATRSTGRGSATS